MKKLINDPHAVVEDMLEGVVLANRDLMLLEGENVVLRRDHRALAGAGKVAVLSGGGAGHEPAHAGYVGRGMLTGAIAGAVFTSPSVDAVLAAIMAVAGPAGVLLIVKNYTGDRLNFGLAAEIARAAGVPVEVLVVGDDVALDDDGSVGRRGIAGTVFVHKVAGAAAEAGLSLAQVKREAERAAQGLFSMGLGLSACIVPAAGKPGFAIGDGEVEYGLGIHGESGVRRGSVGPADEMVGVLLSRIVARGRFQQGERVVLMVNNLGGTAAQELDIVARQALLGCTGFGLRVEASMTGAFLTALEMAGCSLTLMRVDDELLHGLQAPTAATAWHGMTLPAPAVSRVPVDARAVDAMPAGSEWSAVHATRFQQVLRLVTQALRDSEGVLTELDAVVGDGDIGISLARGAQALDDGLMELDLLHPALALQQVSAILRRALGGTSGPLYAVFALRAGVALAEASDPGSVHAWSRAFDAGCEGIMTLGGAARGDRTMLDALLPAAEAVSACAEDSSATLAADRAEKAAAQGTDDTRNMAPRKGRSSYLGQRAIGHVDPGAYAVTVWLKAVALGLGEGSEV